MHILFFYSLTDWKHLALQGFQNESKMPLFVLRVLVFISVLEAIHLVLYTYICSFMARFMLC